MSEKSNKWHETRTKREEELFKGKHFKVVEEFKLRDDEEKLTTPLGYKIKAGYRVVQVTEDGGPTRSLPFVVGKATLKRMHDVYGAVELPEPKKRGRPKKVKLELEEGEHVLSSDEIANLPFEPVTTEQVTVGKVPEQDAKDVPAQSGSQAGPTYDNPNA